MNKLLAILFGCVALGAFVLSQRESFPMGNGGHDGQAAGEAHTISLSRAERSGFVAAGLLFSGVSFYFVTRRPARPKF